MTKKFDKPLNTLVSARVRLTEEQRSILRSAYNKHRDSLVPKEQEPLTPGSSIKATTNYSVNTQLGLADITCRDLLTTRDSIAVPIIIKLQRALGVEVVTREQVLDAASGYVDYVFSDDI